jgi:hypothetical protein
MKARKCIDARIRQNDAEQRQLAADLKRAAELASKAEFESLRAQKRAKFEAERMHQRRQRLDDSVRGFSEQIRMLTSREETPETVSTIMQICDPESARVFVDPNCTDCKGVLMLIPDLSILRCDQCHAVTPFISFDTAANKTAPIEESPGERRAPDEADNDALYREHVEQFADYAPPTPPEVLDVLVKNLDNIGVRCRTKVLPTLIVNILRENDLAGYIKYASRIERELTGARVPRFDRALVDRMVARYKIILSVYKLLRAQLGKTKMINFTALDRLFLKLEGREDQLALLEHHKTIEVIRKENEIIALCRAEAAKISPLQW